MNLRGIYSPLLVERCLYNLKGQWIGYNPARSEKVAPKDILFEARTNRRRLEMVEKGNVGRVSLVRYRLKDGNLHGIVEGKEWVSALAEAKREVPAHILGCYMIDTDSYILYRGALWRLLGEEMEQLHDNLSAEAMFILIRLGVKLVVQEAWKDAV
jgi:hypothetical protein